MHLLFLTGCGKQEAPATDTAQKKDSAELQTVTMASTGSDADVWRVYRNIARN